MEFSYSYIIIWIWTLTVAIYLSPKHSATIKGDH